MLTLQKAKAKANPKFIITINRFALFLNIYSPRAYSYARKFLFLPHHSSIKQQTTSVHFELGLLWEVLEYLSLKVQNNSDMFIDKSDIVN